MMPFRIGPWEIALILVVILLIFGVGKLPQVSGAIGRGLRSFKRGQSGEEDEEREKVKSATRVKKAVKKKVVKS
jgi:sec-independent protein translocase protein TatA